MTCLTGSHKTKCALCGGSDNMVMQYDGKSRVDLCHTCAITAVKVADRNTMIFISRYVHQCREMDPGCHHGSTFTDSCIDNFEEVVWLGYISDYIRKNRKVF